MSQLIDRLRRDESGFSITELLTAMVIGSIVLWALMTLMTTGFTKSREVTDRAEAAQSARAALDRMVTLFDSSLCLEPPAGEFPKPPLIGSAPAQGANPAVVGSDGSYAAFYADLNGISDQPDRYTLTYDSGARTITERRYDSSGTIPNLSFPASPSQTRVLAANVVPARAADNSVLPIFRYFRYGSGGQVETTPMAVPVASSLANDAVRVIVAFQVVPQRTGVEDRRSAVIEGQSALGTPDANTPSLGACP